MGAFANPYVLLLIAAISIGYEVVDVVRAPIHAAVHKVEHTIVATGHVLTHVVTFGKK